MRERRRGGDGDEEGGDGRREGGQQGSERVNARWLFPRAWRPRGNSPPAYIRASAIFSIRARLQNLARRCLNSC